MGKPDAPEAPTPADLEPIIRLQAEVNRTNQRNPYGQQQWSQGPDGRWTNETSFSAPAQALFERQMMMAAQQPRQIDQSQGNPLANAIMQGIADQQAPAGGMKDALKQMGGGGGFGKPGQSGQSQLPPIDMAALLGGDDDSDAAGSSRNPVPGDGYMGRGQRTPGMGQPNASQNAMVPRPIGGMRSASRDRMRDILANNTRGL